ncbi:MAG: hypothetical protein HYX97_03165 [Chloroflexi bacterium]|nr:hypothetical protein [Chloroflexota bacterium]
MAQELITILGESLGGIALKSGPDGSFEVRINGDLVFSRTETFQLPDLDGILQMVYPKLGGQDT